MLILEGMAIYILAALLLALMVLFAKPSPVLYNTFLGYLVYFVIYYSGAGEIANFFRLVVQLFSISRMAAVLDVSKKAPAVVLYEILMVVMIVVNLVNFGGLITMSVFLIISMVLDIAEICLVFFEKISDRIRRFGYQERDEKSYWEDFYHWMLDELRRPTNCFIKSKKKGGNPRVRTP